MPPERLTIDSTVVIDFLDEKQERHALAERLFDLQRAGVVQLALASSGHVFDARENAAERLRRLESEGVLATAQLAYPGVMYPGSNAFPGAAVEGFRDSWEAVLSTWRTHEGAPPQDNDALHVETHVLEGRDVFVTDDRSLRAMCHRLAVEHSVRIVARSLQEYFEDRSGVEMASGESDN
jgi:predicted nucleic acid-binding protein